MFNKRNYVALILGRKGHGKSLLLKSILKRTSRFILVDTQNEHQDIPGVTVCKSVEDVRSVIQRPGWNYLDGDLRIVYQGFAGSIEDSRGVIEFLTNLVAEIGNMTLIYEECNFMMSPGFNGISPALKRIIHVGRHCATESQEYGASFIGVTRRPVGIHIDVRSQADVIMAFNIQERADLEYLETRMMNGLPSPSDLPRDKAILIGEHEDLDTMGIDQAVIEHFLILPNPTETASQ